MHLIGGSAAHFPALPTLEDSALAETLLTHAKTRDPRSLSFDDLTRSNSNAAAAPARRIPSCLPLSFLAVTPH